MGRQFFPGSFLLKLPVFAVILISQSSYAQGYTQADFNRICGTKMEIKQSGSISKYKALDKKVQEENAKVDACIQNLINAEAKKAETDAIPVGGKFPNATINGVPLRKCSHGGVCQGQMLDQIRTGSY